MNEFKFRSKGESKKCNILKIANLIVGWGMIWSYSSIAQADGSDGGLFVEPSITYESGSTSTNYPSPFSSSTGTIIGFGVGARVGFHLNEAFFLALDARYAMPQFKDSSVLYDAKSVSTNWGPVIGLQMPNVGMRLWGSYILGGELNPERSTSFDVNLQNATGYRIGVGFRLAAVSLSLEYQQLKYGKLKLEQLGPFSSGSLFDSVNLANNAWIVGVSFPLQF
jgi:hypothetical protein